VKWPRCGKPAAGKVVVPRKLKTFVTESGFFELAVAAPSMKAALEAWGIKVNLFQQGLAHQTDDTAIIAAAETAPGRVLRRSIGGKGAFSESAELPKVKGASGKTKTRKPQQAIDLKAKREARAALEQAEARHEKRVAARNRERDALEARADREERDWQREKERLEAGIAHLKR
jgi:colicin import membrane protein